MAVDGYGPASYGDAFADVYDQWYADETEVEAAVRRLAALAAGGPALELGVGSGRLAIPLARAGVEVWGVDASEAMVSRLRAKPGGERVRVTISDMADLDLEPAPGGVAPRFSLVFAAYNTLFNLTSRDAQVRCLRRVGAVLGAGGRVVIEAFVPGDALVSSADALVVRSIELGRLVLAASRHDPGTQVLSGQHVEITEAGVRLRPWCVRYASPAQLDGIAAEAGLELVERWEGWTGEPFGDDSATHVSVYRLRGGETPVASRGNP